MKALVSGATGFIGGALAAALCAEGWEVNLLVRPASRERLRAKNWPVLSPDSYNLFLADLSSDTFENSATIQEAVQGCDLVFHAAAIRDRWGTSPDVYRRTNVNGTRHILEASLGRVKRFVHVSSVGVLGFPRVLDIDETFPIRTEIGKVGYHTTKAEAEQVVSACSENIETVIVRPTITYGPGDADGMLTRLIEMISRGRYVQVGRGENHFHLTYIDDLVNGLILAGTHPAAAGETMILAGPQSISVRELISQIEGRLGRRPGRVYLPEGFARWTARGIEAAYRLGASLSIPVLNRVPPVTQDKINTLCVHRGFSSARAARLIGFEPKVGYTEGLEKTMAWMVQEGRLRINENRKRSARA